jgi:hypothetical protein
VFENTRVKGTPVVVLKNVLKIVRRAKITNEDINQKM